MTSSPSNNTFRKNVIFSILQRPTNPWNLSGLGEGNAIDENLYFNAAEAPGFDTISVTSNPRFLDPSSDNYAFAPDSPALAMGIAQLPWASMGVKGFTQTSASTYELENFWGALLDPGTVDPGTGFVLATSQVNNTASTSSLEGQEQQEGLMFVQGDVAPGQIVVAVVDGKDVPCQLNHRVNWPDGSLRTATAVWAMPSIPAGQTKDVVWTRRNGTWTAQDTPKHTSTTAITSKVALEYAFTSWRGRNASNTLTVERGPKYFRSNDMLATSNAPWIERTMAGPVMTEWRVSDFARLGNNTLDPNFAAFLYIRAYGGTANNPARIAFVYRTAHGWTDGSVPADEQGIRVDMDLKVGNTVIRGKTLNTTGWSARDGFKGGFYASCGADGKMDWIDAASGTLMDQPSLVVRHDVSYGIKTKFFPPYDVNNPAYSASASIDFVPQGRGNLSFQQDDVGDNGNIPWHTSTNFAKALIAHARRPLSEVATQDRVARVTAWGIAGLGSIGYNRTTRKLHCYLPPARNPDVTGLGESIWNGTKPTATATDLNPYVKGRDAAHFPQVTWWTALTEGDTHFRDLAMAEATLPGMFEANGAGAYMTFRGLNVGGVSINGQLRAVGQAYKPMTTAYAIADMNDPNGKLAKALLDMQIDASKLIPFDEDTWRGSGTRHQTQGIYRFDSGNEPSYKVWMHLFGGMSTTYGAAITGYGPLETEAHWWMRLPVTRAGGNANDADYLMKPDPFQMANYYLIALSGPGPNGTSADRRAWSLGQWAGAPRLCDYGTDGQTVTFVEGGAPENGMIMTVTGIHNLSAEPPVVTDFSKQPTGLTRGTPYYAVQCSGMSCKLATSPGGTPVNFNTGGAVIRGMIARANVNGVNTPTPLGTVTGSGIASYFTQGMVTLDLYQHYLAPSDSRVRLARNSLKVYKDADTVQGGYDVRGKTTVPY